MRIIAGIAKRLPLLTPHDLCIRPTTDRVREAIFSRIGSHVLDADVLDLFAGVGGLGLEAASRGASSVIFVEKSEIALPLLQQNIVRLKKFTHDSISLVCLKGECFQEIKKLQREDAKFTLIFADPPYGSHPEDLLNDKFLPQLLKEDGIFVLESAKRSRLNFPPKWIEQRTAIYGDTRVSFLGLKMVGTEP